MIKHPAQGVRLFGRQVEVAVMSQSVRLTFATSQCATNLYAVLHAGVPTKVPASKFPLIWCPAAAISEENTFASVTEELSVFEPQWVLVVGSGKTECYNPYVNTWRRLAPIPMRSAAAGVAGLHCLYVAGGQNEQGASASLERYEAQTNSWQILRPMLQARSEFGLALLKNALYAVGGRAFNTMGSGLCWTRYLWSTERYDLEANCWNPVRSLRSTRHSHQVAVVGEHIYAIGGCDGTLYLREVERYDPETNEWSQVAPMITPRRNFGVGVIGRSVYVVGGCGRANSRDVTLRSVDRYDVDSNSWSRDASMPTKRSHLTVSVIGDTLFAIGGKNDGGYLALIEVFDVRTNTWERLEKGTSTEHAGHVAGVLTLL